MNKKIGMDSPLDVNSPDYAENLYDIYAWYRQNDPVHEDLQLDRPGVTLFRYEDVSAALADPRLGSSAVAAELIDVMEARGQHALAQIARDANILTTIDEPDHKRIRDVFQQAYRKIMSANFRDDIATIAENLVDELGSSEIVDIVNDYAGPLSIKVIAKLIGFPVEDYEKLKAWSDNYVLVLDTSQMLDGFSGAGEALLEFREYVLPFIEKRSKEPQNDLLSALASARLRGTISDTELLTNCLLIVTAGSVTTRHLIGSAIDALIAHPHELKKLRDDPSLMRVAVNEFLRYESPLQCVGRVALEDIRIRDTDIPKGTRVRMMIGSANRDEERFERAEALDITRKDSGNTGFGGGIHICLGAHLGRIECEVALSKLLQRYDRVTPVTAEREWAPGHKLRGLKSLPVILD